MKRTLSFLICVALMLSLCSCSFSGNGISINSVNVSEDEYNYFLSVTENSSEFENTNDKEGAAKLLCKKYVAAKELCEKYNISLSAEKTVIVANQTKVNWQLYSSFYEKYSVSKQALNEIYETQAAVDSLVLYLYGENGERALQESEIQNYFDKNFVAVKIISTDFAQDIGEDEIEDVSQKYIQMKNSVNNGVDFASAAQQYPELAKYDDMDTLISSYDTEYPQGFFENIVKINSGELKILRYSTGIYLVQKTDSSQFYEIYRDNCILKMKKSEISSEIDALAKSYKISD